MPVSLLYTKLVCAQFMDRHVGFDCNKALLRVARMVERRTVEPLTQVRFPGAARDFSPRVNFQRRLSYGVRTPPCAIACINVCADVKDPVVHVRARSVDHENAKIPSLHFKLGGTTLPQLTFLGEGN